uniref:AMP_N domain-containing protein n=1 Tax=Schistosoma curassoni TaxID=6186 RepID=A0A183K9V1_9TREM
MVVPYLLMKFKRHLKMSAVQQSYSINNSLTSIVALVGILKKFISSFQLSNRLANGANNGKVLLISLSSYQFAYVVFVSINTPLIFMTLGPEDISADEDRNTLMMVNTEDLWLGDLASAKYNYRKMHGLMLNCVDVAVLSDL